jgi:phage-related protein
MLLAALCTVAVVGTFFTHVTPKAKRSFVVTLAAPKAEAGGVVRAIGRAVGGAFRAVGRAVGGAFRAVGRAVGHVTRGIGNVVRHVGKAIGSAAKAVGKAVGSVARTIGKGIVAGVKAIGKGVVQIGKGIVQVAKGVGKFAVGVVKGAVSFAGGVVKGLGHVIRGDFKGAWNSVKAGASSAVSHVVTGAKEGFKDVSKGVGNIIAGAGKVAMGAVQLALPFLDVEAILKKIKEAIVGFVKKIAGGILSALDGVFGKVLGVISPDVKRAIDTVRSLVNAGQTIIDAIQNPDEYLHKGREWAINKLTDLAMRVFETPLKKLVGAITGVGLKLLKHLITTPLTGMLTSLVASVTLGIGVALAPIIKLGIDKFLDWAIDMVKDGLAHLVMAIPFVRGFLRDSVITPVINGGYDMIVRFIQKKFPAVAKHITTAAARAEGITAKPVLQNELGGVKNLLGQVDGVLSAVQSPRAAVQGLVQNLVPVKAVVAKLDSVIGQVKSQKGALNAQIGEVKARIGGIKALLARATGVLKPGLAGNAATAALKSLAPEIKKATGFLATASKVVTALPKAGAPAALKSLAGELANVKGVFTNARNLIVRVAASGAAEAKAKAMLAGELGANATKAVAEVKKLAAKAPRIQAPVVVENPRSVAQVVASVPRAAQDTVIEKPAISGDAPIVRPRRASRAQGLRTALRTVYSLLTQDWRAALLGARNLMVGTTRATEGDVMREILRRVGIYRSAVHSAFRLVYSVRLLQLRAAYNPKVGRFAPKVTAALALETGEEARFEGDLAGLSAMERPFVQAKEALVRFAQNSERFLHASKTILDPRRRGVVHRTLGVLISRVTRARTALEEIVTIVQQAAGEAGAGM